MMNGASTLEGLRPRTVDATIVTRACSMAGGTHRRQGPTASNFCFSGGQPHLRPRAPVPQSAQAPAYSAVGSSSGSAALVAAGERVEHGDRRRSGRLDPHFRPVRIAASTAMKPTHGPRALHGQSCRSRLTLDHRRADGPPNRGRQCTAARGARRPPTALDPRQGTATRTTRPTPRRSGGASTGLRDRASSRKGFGPSHTRRKDVDAKSAGALPAVLSAKLGAKVGEVSVPMHAMGPGHSGPADRARGRHRA